MSNHDDAKILHESAARIFADYPDTSGDIKGVAARLESQPDGGLAERIGNIVSSISSSYGYSESNAIFDIRRELAAVPPSAPDQSARIAELERELDPPVCRLQFPDGTVPGNAREAAEGWHREANRFWNERDELKAELARMRAVVEKQESQIKELDALRTSDCGEIAKLETELASQDAEIGRMRTVVEAAKAFTKKWVADKGIHYESERIAAAVDALTPAATLPAAPTILHAWADQIKKQRTPTAPIDDEERYGIHDGSEGDSRNIEYLPAASDSQDDSRDGPFEVPLGCNHKSWVSRMCKRGTAGCEQKHESAASDSVAVPTIRELLKKHNLPPVDDATGQRRIDALTGVETGPRSTLPDISLCPRCEGTGRYQDLPDDAEQDCVLCNGTGRIGRDGEAFKAHTPSPADLAAMLPVGTRVMINDGSIGTIATSPTVDVQFPHGKFPQVKFCFQLTSLRLAPANPEPSKPAEGVR